MKKTAALLLVILVICTCACNRTTTPAVVSTTAPTAASPQVSVVATTDYPTEGPTVIPTLTPTLVPTIVPTVVPTAIPTVIPTLAPTLVPVDEPTAQPTLVPTLEPTAQPTVVPMETPILTPTVVPTATPTESPTASPTVCPFYEGIIPDRISEMEEIPFWDLYSDRVYYQTTNCGFNYNCVEFTNMIVTRVTGMGYYLIIVGEFYYDPATDCFAPYGVMAHDTSIRIKPTLEGFILYANVFGEAEFILPAEPIDTYEPGAYVYTEKIDGTYVSVIVPELYQGVQININFCLSTIDVYLPGQLRQDCYLNNEICRVNVYRYNYHYFTKLQMLETNVEIWVKGLFLYDARYDRMSIQGNGDNIYIKYNGDHFDIYAREVGGIYANYQQNDNLYFLGTNCIGIIQRNGLNSVSLFELEGVPLLMYPF